MNIPAKTFIIAEAGVNHNGDFNRAIAMIDAAQDCGVDAIKFQTFIPELLVTSSADKAAYQKKNDARHTSQREMLASLALTFDEQERLFEYCQSKQISFLSSPFDLVSADFLIGKLGLKTIKLGSGEITNAPLLHKITRHDCKLILSTGMSTLAEIDTALAVCAFGYSHKKPPENLQACLAFSQDNHFDNSLIQDKITLMHCTTSYPCPINDVNLSGMQTIKLHTGLPVGYSDHTEGILISCAAVAAGATMIEKHFTLDRNLPGPDHKASIEPDELCHLVSEIKIIENALGNNNKTPTKIESQNAAVARKSLVAFRDIAKGEVYTEKNLTTKRPGTGVSAMKYWDYLGKEADRDYKNDELIEP